MSAGPSVVVVGAGVFGSAIALGLARSGAVVTLCDPSPIGDNASGAAAGMLAPAFEALLDEASHGRFGLLAAARSLWPEFLGEIGEAAVDLRRGGALWLALEGEPPDTLEARLAGLEALGARPEIWSRERIGAEVSGLNPGAGPGVFTPEDWRLAPGLALDRLHRAAKAAGARLARERVMAFDASYARLASGERLAADWLVVASGAERSDLAPELVRLAPIKGHILRFSASGFAGRGPTLRCRSGYATGGVDGLCIGATMEAGLADRTIDPAAVERLRALADSFSSSLASAPFEAQAAVRATSPDGLPMVGPSARSGVILAVGARRNGWLLAPLVARAVTDFVAGRAAAREAALMDPRRFD